MRVIASSAVPPGNGRSFSGSRKLPVEEFTGSFTKPVVGAPPHAVGGSMVRSDRVAPMPAAASDASSAASESVVIPPAEPASSNAAAMVFAHAVSFVFAFSHAVKPEVTGPASMPPKSHVVMKSATAPESLPG